MRALIVAVLTLTAGVAHAESLAQIDEDSACGTEEGAAYYHTPHCAPDCTAEDDYRRCMMSNEASRDQLRKDWADLKEETQLKCLKSDVPGPYAYYAIVGGCARDELRKQLLEEHLQAWSRGQQIKQRDILNQEFRY